MQLLRLLAITANHAAFWSLQVRQLTAAYEKLAMESERHVRALQRTVAVASDERKQALRVLDDTNATLANTKRELQQAHADLVVKQDKVRSLCRVPGVSLVMSAAVE